MKKAVIAAALLLAASATPALADHGRSADYSGLADYGRPYIGLNAGLSIPHDSSVTVGGNNLGNISYDPGYALGASVGYEFNPARIELEYTYRDANTKQLGVSGSDGSTDLSVSSYMVNGLFNFKTDRRSAVSPFVGAGIGVLNGKVNEGGVSVSDTEFGYQLMAGAEFNLSRNVDLDLTYKFQGAASDFNMSGTSVSYHSSNVLAGLRFKF